MAKDHENKKFVFGFLNNAQDEVDLKTIEASAISSLDADKLALGTLEPSTYIDAG